jgi:hypothetical protein
MPIMDCTFALDSTFNVVRALISQDVRARLSINLGARQHEEKEVR